MELKTLIAIGLVVFIVGALIFLKIFQNNKSRPGAACAAPLYISLKIKRRFSL